MPSFQACCIMTRSCSYSVSTHPNTIEDSVLPHKFTITNFMIIKSDRKKCMPVNIQIRNIDGTSHHIKYLGEMIDDCVSWKYHISYICTNLQEYRHYISKLRHYLSVKQLKHIYFNLIYPYISYAILAWGSTYISSLQEVQVKQNHVAQLIFFANTRGKDT